MTELNNLNVSGDLLLMFEEYEDSIEDFLETLGYTNPDYFTKREWELISVYVRSDGCTNVPDFYRNACVEHDFYFRTHHDFEGKVISFMEANKRFRMRIQRLSKFGVCSPLAWWRWAAVCVFGGRFWSDKKKCRI